MQRTASAKHESKWATASRSIVWALAGLAWVVSTSAARHGVPGSSADESRLGSDAQAGATVVALGDAWLAAWPAQPESDRELAGFRITLLRGEPTGSLLVGGRLIGLIGGPERAWALRWDEASGALELAAIEASSGGTASLLVIERWTRIGALSAPDSLGLILNVIDEPILDRSVPRSVLTPIDRPIDWEESSRALLNPIEELERSRSAGSHLALLPAGNDWEGLAAWRDDEGVAWLALFDSEADAHVQALPGAGDEDSLLHVASGGEWLAWQAIDESGFGPVLLAELSGAGLDDLTELDAGLLLAAWEAEGLVNVLSAAPVPSVDAPALGAYPIKPPNEPPRGAAPSAIPSKPIIPIGAAATSDVLDGDWRFLLHRFSQKPIIPIEFE